jgi:ABC-type transporter Mla MlaB component
MLKQKMEKAEQCTLKGDMTEEELVKLQEEFGSFLEEETVA